MFLAIYIALQIGSELRSLCVPFSPHRVRVLHSLQPVVPSAAPVT